MYSIVLLLAIQSPAEATALPRLGGCSGLFGIRPALASRPVRSAGCSGGFFGLVRGIERTRTRTVTTTRSTASAPALMEARPGIVTRLVVHRQLRVALQSSNVPESQRAAIKKALDDPDVYAAAVAKVTRDINKKLTGHNVGALGDGTILRILLDNLPKIVDAILKILDALS